VECEPHRRLKRWICDLRIDKHFTLKENQPKRSDLDDFVACYNPKNRYERKESERFKSFAYEDLLKRDKLNLDISWLKDESLGDSANLPDPDIIAAEIVEDFQAALAQLTRSLPPSRPLGSAHLCHGFPARSIRRNRIRSKKSVVF
jgi:type I restriction enzyme M protein